MSVRLIAFPLAMALLVSSLAFSQHERGTHQAFAAKLYLRTTTGWRSMNVKVNFEQDRMVLHEPKIKSTSESIRYAEITEAAYTHTMDRRTIDPATALVANVFAPLLMKPTEYHWLTIKSNNAQTILNLDKNDYKAVVAAFESNAGQKVAGWQVTTVATRR